MFGKTIVRMFLVLLMTLAFTSAAWAASPKIGFFDYEKIIDQSKWGQRAMQELERKHKALRQQVDRKANEFKALKEEFDKKRSLLDDRALSSKLKQLQSVKREGEKMIMESSSELRKLESQLSAPITEKIIEIVQNIAQREGYDYIFEQRMSGMFFGDPKHELTQRIIRELDKAAPK
jgi:outer membrane protein